MKDRQTYKILTYCSIFFPINRFYLGEKVGVIRLFANGMGICGIADLFYIDKRFDEAMAKRGFTNTNIRNEQGK